MKKVCLTILGMLLVSNVATAKDSVYEWGSWQEESDIVAAILAGADPAEVTAPTAAGPGAAGTAAQAIVPAAFDNVLVSQEGMPRGFGSADVVPTALSAGPPSQINIVPSPNVIRQPGRARVNIVPPPDVIQQPGRAQR